MIVFLTTLFQSIGKEVIIGLITAAVVAGFAFAKKLYASKKAKALETEKQKILEHKQEIMNGLRSYVATTEDLKELCLNTGAVRAIIVQLHNGGHMPEIGKQLKVTIVAEWACTNHNLISQDFQGAFVGADYIMSVVKPMLVQDKFYLKTEDMRPGSMLRDYYTVSNIIGSKLALIGIDEQTESTFLLALHFEREHPEVDESFRAIHREKTRSVKSKLNLV